METTPWDPEGATVVLDVDGRLSDASGAQGVDLKAFYKALVQARSLDLRLARIGLPMWASSAGEEAPLVAMGLVAGARDWIYPGLRDVAVALTRGVGVDALVDQVLGRSDETALPGRVSSAAHRIAPVTDALGMHLALATGHARAMRLQRSGQVAFASFGEGVTTTGAFHESTMTAVASDLPIVFVCRSQVWPSGAPAEAGTVGDPVAERAKASGLWSRRIDGADPLAVHAALSAAAIRARDGRGPGLVEVVVTPMHHDPPAHRDPVERLRRHLDQVGLWTQTFQDVVEAEFRKVLDRAFESREGNGEARE